MGNSRQSGGFCDANTMIVSVEAVMGGEPVFKGTRIPVRLISAMKAQGATTQEILDGYPALTAEMVELAESWAAAHPVSSPVEASSVQTLVLKSSKRVPLKPSSDR